MQPARRCWTRRTPRCTSMTRAVCCDSVKTTAENKAQNLGLTALKAAKTPWQGANGTERSTPETSSGPPVPGATLPWTIAAMNLRDIAMGMGGTQSRSPLLLEPVPIRASGVRAHRRRGWASSLDQPTKNSINRRRIPQVRRLSDLTSPWEILRLRCQAPRDFRPEQQSDRAGPLNDGYPLASGLQPERTPIFQVDDPLPPGGLPEDGSDSRAGRATRNLKLHW